ncbi:MAG: dipicolinate synthase subunit DpsA [Muricomes sp.]
MEHPQYDYAVIGGDMRQVYLTEELAFNGNKICHHGLISLPDGRRFSDTSCVVVSLSLEEACMNSSCIICPIPLTKRGSYLNQNAFMEEIPLDAVVSALQPGQHFFAGCIPEDLKKLAMEKGVFVFDFMEDDSLAIYNTIATAEGAICEAVSKSAINLNGSRCAVLGYGKCGRTLASYLKGLFCHVYVCAENLRECAEASVIAEDTGNLKDFKKRAGEFDFIFNTIPAPVITSDMLESMKNSVTIIDIASAPGA